MNENLHRAVPPAPAADPEIHGDDPARIERDIDHTRERISRTVDALEQKLSPSEFADQALEVVRSRGGEFATNLMDQIQRNPLPAIVTAAGLLWLMSANGTPRRWPYPESSRGGLRDRIGDAADRAGQMASGIAERGSDMAHSVAERGSSVAQAVAGAAQSVVGAARSVKDSVAGAGTQFGRGTERVRHDADRAFDTIREGSYRARSEFEHLLHEQPIVVGAIGVAVGAAIGALLPVSEAENRAMGSASDEVASRIGALSSEGLEMAREKVGEVADEIGKAVGEANSGNSSARDARSGVSGSGTSTTGNSSAGASSATNSLGATTSSPTTSATTVSSGTSAATSSGNTSVPRTS